MYLDLDHLFETVRRVGQKIGENGLPPQFAPYVFAVTSNGRVAAGALEVLECLPHTYVDPEELDSINPSDNKQIFITNILAEHMVKRKDPTDTSPFVEGDYFKNPTGYESNFS